MTKKIFKSGLKKENINKTRFDLIPIEILDEIAKQFMYGAKKYGKDNWKLGNKNEIHIFKEAALRHTLKWVHNIKDKDNHSAAAITNIIMYQWLIKYNEKNKF